PSRRKARLASSLARTWPVSETISPSAPCSTVTVRTGRAAWAGGAVFSQPVTIAAIKRAVAIRDLNINVALHGGASGCKNGRGLRGLSRVLFGLALYRVVNSGARLRRRQHGRSGPGGRRRAADALQPVRQQGGDLPGGAAQGGGPSRARISARHRNAGRRRGRASPRCANDPGGPQEPGILRLSAHGGFRFPTISLDRRGVRGRYGPL